MQLLVSIRRDSQLRAQLLEARLVAKEDQVNFGGIPRAVEKALRDGSYTAISHFWGSGREACEYSWFSGEAGHQGERLRLERLDSGDVEDGDRLHGCWSEGYWAAGSQPASWRDDYFSVLLQAIG